jgi:hypothetical protein
MTTTWQALLDQVKIEHIAQAIEDNKTGKWKVPKGRRARSWCIEFEGVAYPTKYVLARAVELATGQIFPPDVCKGGRPTIKALERILNNDPRFKLGFRPGGSNSLEE